MLETESQNNLINPEASTLENFKLAKSAVLEFAKSYEADQNLAKVITQIQNASLKISIGKNSVSRSNFGKIQLKSYQNHLAENSDPDSREVYETETLIHELIHLLVNQIMEFIISKEKQVSQTLFEKYAIVPNIRKILVELKGDFLLFFSEGLTQYFTDIVLNRSGLEKRKFRAYQKQTKFIGLTLSDGENDLKQAINFIANPASEPSIMRLFANSPNPDSHYPELWLEVSRIVFQSEG